MVTSNAAKYVRKKVSWLSEKAKGTFQEVMHDKWMDQFNCEEMKQVTAITYFSQECNRSVKKELRLKKLPEARTVIAIIKKVRR